jgi:hypothetical protein
VQIRYLESRDHDRPARSETSDERNLAKAIAHAEATIRNIKLTPPPGAWSPVAIGFVIYDDAGHELHRQYVEGK